MRGNKERRGNKIMVKEDERWRERQAGGWRGNWREMWKGKGRISRMIVGGRRKRSIKVN